MANETITTEGMRAAAVVKLVLLHRYSPAPGAKLPAKSVPPKPIAPKPAPPAKIPPKPAGKKSAPKKHPKKKASKKKRTRKKRPVPPSAAGRVHGNSLSSPRTAYLYRLEDADGNLLKWGVTQDFGKRYAKSFSEGKKLKKVASGARADIIRKERGLVETQPGPLNFERWAGSRFGEQP